MTDFNSAPLEPQPPKTPPPLPDLSASDILDDSDASNEGRSLAFRARLLIGSLLGVLTLSLISLTFAILQGPEPSLLFSFGLAISYTLVLAYSFYLSQRAKIAQAAWQVIVGTILVVLFSVINPTSSVAASAVGLILLVLVISIELLPRKQIVVGITVGALSATFILLIDFYFYQTSTVPYFQGEQVSRSVNSNVLVGIFVLIFLSYIFWQFPRYDIQVKLIVGFLVVTLGSVSMTAVSLFFITQTQLEDNVGQELNRQVTNQANLLGNGLVQEVNLLTTLATDWAIRASIVRSNNQYALGNLRDMTRQELVAELNAQDQTWRLAPDNDVLVQSRLQNNVARELTRFQESFPDHLEMLVTDREGALIAAVERPEDFYYGNEQWWQTTRNDGTGRVRISEPEFDQSLEQYVLSINLPILDETGQVIGILHSRYDFTEIITLLEAVPLQVDGGLELFFSNNQVLEVGHEGQGDQLNIPEQDLSVLRDMLFLDEPSRIMTYENIESVVSTAEIVSLEGRDFIESLDWFLVLHQDRAAITAAVTQETERISTLITLLVIIVAIAAAVFVSNRITGPILRLTQTAQRFAAGDFAVRATPQAHDEVATLARVFNIMATRLYDTIGSLEGRVTERTQRLELLLSLNRRLSAILDPNILMREVVNRTKEAFNFYHVHIYLLDDNRETLVMEEGYGEAGRIMKQENHSIEMSTARSVVAQAARESRVILVNDVRQNENWLANPLLPDTRSEVAVPIILENRVIGVMDVQSVEPSGFSNEDQAILQALADQIAVAVRNARSYTKTQETLRKNERVQQAYTFEAWNKLRKQRDKLEFEVRTGENLPLLKNTPTPEANAALDQGETIRLTLPAGQALAETNGDASQTAQFSAQRTMATPLKLRNQIIGVLGLHHPEADREWSENEIALIEAVSNQMSLALENARLFEETGRRAARERLIAEATQQIWASGELERVMQAAIEQLGTTLDADKVIIRLGTTEDLDKEH